MKTNAKVYVMVDNDGRIKLGHSIDPAKRSKQMVRPVTLVHETDIVEEAERIERLAHRILALHGKHLRGEWFEASVGDAIKAIEIAVRQAEQEELALGGKLDGASDIAISEYTPVTSIRLPEDIREWADKKAQEQNRSRANLIITVLRDAMRSEARRSKAEKKPMK